MALPPRISVSLHGAIGFHDDAEAYDAADPALFEDAGILRLDALHNFAATFL